MTKEKAREYKETARGYEEGDNMVDAAEAYSAMSHEYFGEWEPSLPFSNISSGMYGLLKAGTCYRVAGSRELCEFRCREGVLMAEEMKFRVNTESVPENTYDKARRGSWDEYIGDFRLIANRNGVAEAYEAARETYREAGDPETAFAEQEHLGLLNYFREVAKDAGYDEEELGRVNTSIQFSEWVEYKREHLPNILDYLESRI